MSKDLVVEKDTRYHRLRRRMNIFMTAQSHAHCLSIPCMIILADESSDFAQVDDAAIIGEYSGTVSSLQTTSNIVQIKSIELQRFITRWARLANG